MTMKVSMIADERNTCELRLAAGGAQSLEGYRRWRSGAPIRVATLAACLCADDFRTSGCSTK